MDCKEIRELLPARIDGELGLRDTLDIDQHLQSCPACRAEHAQLAAARTALKTHAAYFAAPADLASHIRRTLPSPRRARTTWNWANVGALAASVVAIIWGIGVYLTLPTATERLTDEVIADHVRSLMLNHATDVASTDQHTVKPWFDGKLDFSPPVHDLAAEGFPLIGGRLDYLDRRPVAALVYRYKLHVINLFISPATESEDIPPQSVSRNGYHVVYWTSGGMAYRAVSDVEPAQLARFKDLVMADADRS